jgi:hypothetical protein
MNINLKQSLKKEVLQYMRDNEINLELVESIDLTKDEMKRGQEDGSVVTYYYYDSIFGYLRDGHLTMKINDKVIPVQEKGE